MYLEYLPLDEILTVCVCLAAILSKEEGKCVIY